MAELEDGYRGIATSSGMGAVNTIYSALLQQGDHMVSTDAVYGPSRVVMEKHYSKFGIESTYVDTSKPDWCARPYGPIPGCSIWKLRQTLP